MRPVRWSRGAFGLTASEPGNVHFRAFSHSVWSMDLRHSSALNRGAKSLWCQVAVVCR